MTNILWKKGNVPEGLPVRQVYGICFTDKGQVLLRIEDGKYKLTGGKPEEKDISNKETLKREFLEEVNTKISDPIIVGYQLIDEEDGSPKYAQIRMTAKIISIGKAKSDPDKDSKWIYGRFLTSPQNAIKLLNWGQVGKEQIQDALEIAKKHFNIQECNIEDCLLNKEFKNK